MSKILAIIGFGLTPPWSDGLRVFARGLLESISNVNGYEVEISNLDSELEGHYDFVHVVSTGNRILRKATKNLRDSIVFKHIITPSLGFTNAMNTKCFYTIMGGFGARLVKCFSSDFVARSYFMRGDFLIPPSINITNFYERDSRSKRLSNIFEKSETGTKTNNITDFDNEDFVLYSGPLSADRFPYIQVLNGIKQTKSKILVIGRNTTNNDHDFIDEIVAYSRKIDIEKNVAVAVKVLSEEEKLSLINSARVVIQPFDNNIQKVAVDPPIFLLESMACCRPVITSRAYSLETIIRHGHNGYLVEWNDPIQFSEALYDCLNNNSIGNNARTTVQENFSVEAVSNKLRNMYLAFS